MSVFTIQLPLLASKEDAQNWELLYLLEYCENKSYLNSWIISTIIKVKSINVHRLLRKRKAITDISLSILILNLYYEISVSLELVERNSSTCFESFSCRHGNVLSNIYFGKDRFQIWKQKKIFKWYGRFSIAIKWVKYFQLN